MTQDQSIRPRPQGQSMPEAECRIRGLTMVENRTEAKEKEFICDEASIFIEIPCLVSANHYRMTAYLKLGNEKGSFSVKLASLYRR